MNDDGFTCFLCDHCHTEIEATFDLIGQETECPACGAKLVVAPQEQTSTQAQQDAMKSRTIRIELSDI